MSKLLSDLNLTCQLRARHTYEDMRNDPILKACGVETIAISETKRELAVQMAYYSRSRMGVEDVKAMYRAAGLYEPSEEECKTANTWTLNSRHLSGNAVDFVPVKDGKYWWNAPEKVWERMGVIGESNGLTWGGRWKNRDCPHFECTGV